MNPSKHLSDFFEAAFQDDEISQSLKKVNQLIWFDYTHNGTACSFWVNARPEKLEAGQGVPKGIPELTMSLSADDAHLTWSNKLNPVAAITRKMIIIKVFSYGLLACTQDPQGSRDLRTGTQGNGLGR